MLYRTPACQETECRPAGGALNLVAHSAALFPMNARAIAYGAIPHPCPLPSRGREALTQPFRPKMPALAYRGIAKPPPLEGWG